MRPAALWLDSVAFLPRYKPSANFPMLNSTAVTIEPNQTLRHAIRTSGM
ncbi:MAG TPA: hypothetical protein VE974_11605 [Thermoanaerobaculia bacterium]|nr:hypothetical protein [Thermoanaerobaculia bacterium]